LGKHVKKLFNSETSGIAGDEIEEFWALKDLNFEIKQGETVGIIGRNGAGKSTLLKVLSRITEPTKGRIELKGRVASLLEVGTGFHPELSGRENIFLNGAILGMSRAEIKRKFDEIVAFSEVENFLDTPVKRYSSGMYVRLAFAVAAHLESEILIVDEVLAVGDAEFQKKCLGKMSDVSKENGKTVLFVSHNMAAVEHLCPKSIMLEGGTLSLFSDTHAVMERYLTSSTKDFSDTLLTSTDIDLKIEVLDENNSVTSAVKCGVPLTFNLFIQPKRQLLKADATIVVFNLYGQRILTFDTRFQATDKPNLKSKCTIIANWNKNILCPGTYEIQIGIYENGAYLVSWEKAMQLTVLDNDYYSTGRLPDSGQGHILTDANWSYNFSS
jgi:lipopolysaccharide transport system ATP-binding protein